MRGKNHFTINSKIGLLKNNWGKALMIAFPCFVFSVLLIIFSWGYIILGAEGNYIVNFQLIRDVGSSSWVPHIQGIGFPSSSLNSLVGIFDFFSFLQKVGFSIKVTNIISVWLTYVLPFLSMLWLLGWVLKVRFFTAYVISLFYILNPFSTYHLQGVMFWNVAPLFVLPLIFGCIYKYYLERFKLFLLFGVLSTTLSFSFSNIPYLGVFHIFLVISIIIIPFIRNIKWELKTALSNFLIVELSFILFNAWWFITLVRFQVQDLALYYTKEFAIGWVREYSTESYGIMERLFSLKTLISSENGNYFSDFYNSAPATIILFIPFFLILFNFLIEAQKQNKNNKRFAVATLLSLLLVLFLNKGATKPFGDMYAWMLAHVPFFYMFKTPLEKFSVLSVFLLALALVPVFRNVKSKWLYGIFFIYLIVCSIPYFTLNFMPDDNFDPGGSIQSDKYITKKYLYKKDYLNAAESLNVDKLDYRVLSLPGSVNYQTTILNHDGNKYYRGMDPFIFSVNKPFITAYFDPVDGFFDPIFDNLSNNSIDEVLNIYSIRKIVFNRDIYPSFGTFREDRSTREPITDVLSSKYEKSNFDSINVFSRKDFLPHLYLPQSIILSTASINKLPEIVSAPDYHTRSVIYFLRQNNSLINDRVKILASEQASGSSVLEYKKISPTKYRIIIHRARREFPVVLSESFHNGWKMYLTNSSLTTHIPQQGLSGYKVLDGNEEDQANKDELEDYISQGWISTLGAREEKSIKHWKGEDNVRTLDYTEKYTVDFISKNFQGTIQNDNLPGGRFWETWLPTSYKVESGKLSSFFEWNKDVIELPEENHLMANGYANSWIIDTNEVCKVQSEKLPSDDSFCIKNSDGSYDFEIIVEFWPQRLYYLGCIISITTLIFCLLWMGFLRVKNSRENAIALMTEADNSAKIEQ